MKRSVFWLASFVFILAACGPHAQFINAGDNGDLGTPTENPATEEAVESPARLPTPTPFPQIIAPAIRRPNFTIRIPDFNQSIPFDGIFPIYTPQFVNAVDSPLDPDELVIGITMKGEAKAYPVTVLRFREMVNDELAGIPILVTW